MKKESSPDLSQGQDGHLDVWTDTEAAPLEPDQGGEGLERQEFEAMEIPEHWLPLPLFIVRNIPAKRDITEDDVKKMVEGVRQLRVHSVHFDQAPTEKVLGRRSALVRLEPLPLPWQTNPDLEVKEEANEVDVKDEDEQKGQTGTDETREASKRRKTAKKNANPPRDGDTGTFANWAIQKLKMQNPPFQIGGEQVTFESSTLQVQLYIGNLSPEWQEDIAFVEAMAQYGSLERAYVMRNAAGLSKGYGFVEFSLPSAAAACKRAMDEIERNMRPDPKKMAAKPPPKKLERKDEASEKGEGDGEEVDKKKEEERQRANAFKLAGWPEGGPRLVKLLRAELACIRTVESMFSKVLYVANLRTHQGSQQQLKELFEQFGKVHEVTVPKNKATNSTKGFAFVLFENGLSADSAYRALEKSGSEEIGGALVSFANPAKQADYQGRNGMNAAPRPPNPMGRGTPVVRPGPGPLPAMFPPARAGRGVLPARGAFTPDRGMAGRGRGFLQPLTSDPYQAQLSIQQDLQAQQARMQQEMEQRLQTQMQAQLRQAQMQLQQAQQQAQLLQRQALQAQQKAATEAEARKRAEEEARRAAALAAANKPPLLNPAPKRGPAGFGMGEGLGSRGAPQGVYGNYGNGSQAGGPSAKFNTSQAGNYGAPPGYGALTASAGFGTGSQGYGSHSGGGYGQGGYGLNSSQGYGASESYGAGGAGYGPSDYEGGGYGGQGGYSGGGGEGSGYGQGSYDQSGGYEQGYGYGAEAGYEGASGGGQGDYGSTGYGQGSGAGYGETSVYGQSGYGEYSHSQGASAAGQKRSNPYQQAGYGGYAAGQGYGSQGEAGKRQRY